MNKIELIQSLVGYKARVDKLQLDLEAVFGSDFVPDSGSFQVLNDMLYSHCELVSQLTGISVESICWFIWENDCGESRLKCSLDGKDFTVGTVEDFIAFEDIC